MTKMIRVENADNSSYKVVAEVWDKGQEGQPDKLGDVRELNSAAALAEIYIHATRYVVVKEKSA